MERDSVDWRLHRRAGSSEGRTRQGAAFPHSFHVDAGRTPSRAADPGGTPGHAAPLRTVERWAIVSWRRTRTGMTNQAVQPHRELDSRLGKRTPQLAASMRFAPRGGVPLCKASSKRTRRGLDSPQRLRDPEARGTKVRGMGRRPPGSRRCCSGRSG
jgi:hypothetical protein